MCKQKDCGCRTKGRIKPTLKYCGSELPCTGIVKGDDYSTVLQKIDAVACSGGGEGGEYTFAESETCPNGGLVVMKDGVQVFEQCYECCESGQKTVKYEEFRNFLQFAEVSTIQNSHATPAHTTQVLHTITALDGAGIYELYFHGIATIEDELSVYIGTYKNGLMEDPIYTTWLEGNNMGETSIKIPITVFKSNITLDVGDTVGIGAYNNIGTFVPTVSVVHCKWKLTKLE